MDRAREEQYKTALRRARDLIHELQGEVQTMHEPVAIIGMSCLFPGDAHRDADTPDLFGHLLRSGYDAVVRVPEERAALWQSRHDQDAAPRVPGLEYAALLKHDLFAFDRELFGQIPAEAAMNDPQHRLLLELSWQALLDAGLLPSALAGEDVGVFTGKTGTEYLFDQLGTDRNSADDPYVMTGNMNSAQAGRISYFYDWNGPCQAVESACSTALLAVMNAVNSLRAGECTLAMVGSVNLLLGPTPSHWLNAMHSLAPDGRCKAFGNSANGFGRGEGGGVLVLERLSDAQRQGHRIHAVILGGAVGSDGRSAGFTVPSAAGQRHVISRALANAGIQPAQVGFVETHGTGTPVGDPIEVESLARVYGSRKNKLLIGSVKSNIAHLEAAAGMAGLIKAVLAVRDGVIPASLHCTPLNGLLVWDQLPVQVVAETRPWPEGYERRIAGIDSFGITGTLVHLLVAQPPEPVSDKAGTTRAEPDYRVLPLSARSAAGLSRLAAGCARLLEQGEDFSAMCTAAAARPQEPERLALVAADAQEALTGLRAFVAGKKKRCVVRGRQGKTRPGILFLCSGQGSQQGGMGRELAALFPVFRQVLERCDELAAPRLGYSLLEVMFAENDPRLQDIRCVQPAIYAHQAALAALWRECGVQPDAVFGHSIGEYAAAHIAGVLDLETGLDITLTRGELAASIRDQGAMAAVLGSESEVADVLSTFPGVSLAAVNGPATVTIAGEQGQVDDAVQSLRKRGLESRPLPVSLAFHSPMIEPMLDDFRTFLRGKTFSAPRLRMLSGCSGEYLSADTDWADYFCRQTRRPVRFLDAMLHAREDVYIELGASPILTSYGRQCREDGIWLFSQNPGAVMQPLAQSLARLYVMGCEPDWGWEADGVLRPEAMPVYPFEREHLLPDFVQHPVPRAPGNKGPIMPDSSFSPEKMAGHGGGDVSAQLALLQQETFRQVCQMQQEFLGAGSDGEKGA
ncbi:type I polyketide synthase [Desulfoplanes formicivorans]|uniref:Anatoxin-a synthetase G polyketide synthase n=1 Tax=Desulfoplanes formicivorans TaxID=1592317 RepID=A0A194AH18_9BACT|nr:type I polyketide synthase [Desulfoplanes formicivorans]GAU08623.1 anatoxin-a synthetase G polyketide synthase [Desulfoplanes formicivorans]